MTLTTVTPAEVAFSENCYDGLFYVNRFVDLVFVLDIVLQFFLAYVHEENGLLVKDRGRIANRSVPEHGRRARARVNRVYDQ